MANPKSKTSRSKRNMRRSHHKIDPATSHVHTCENTGQYYSSHKAYKANDGAYYYKGEPISFAKASKEAEEQA